LGASDERVEPLPTAVEGLASGAIIGAVIDTEMERKVRGRTTESPRTQSKERKFLKV
jgi:hypothetical protein